MDFNIKDISFRNLFLRKYKRYGLNDLDCLVVLLSDELTELDNSVIITSSLLADYMSTPKNEIDKSLDKLFKKGFMTISINSNKKVSFDKIKNLLFEDLKKDISISKSINDSLVLDNKQINIVAYLQETWKRNLSPIEMNKLSSLQNEGYSVNQIKNAIDYVCSKGKTTLTSISKYLKENKDNNTLDQLENKLVPTVIEKMNNSVDNDDDLDIKQFSWK